MKRYKEINRPNKIRSEESFRKTLSGGDNPKDQYNPSIGIVTDLIKPTATKRATSWDTWSMAQVFRSFDANKVASYTCINMPMAWRLNVFAKESGEYIPADCAYNKLTTASLDAAWAWYESVVSANLARWK